MPSREGQDARVPVGVGVRMIAALRVDDRGQLGARLIDGRAVGEPREQRRSRGAAVLPTAASVSASGAQTSAPSGVLKPAGATPTTSYGSPSKRTLLPTICGSARKAARPQRVAEHHAMMLPGCASLSINSRPSIGVDAEQLEEARRHAEARHLLGNVDAGQVGVPPLIDRPVLDGRRLLSPLAEIGGRSRSRDREASRPARRSSTTSSRSTPAKR